MAHQTRHRLQKALKRLLKEANITPNKPQTAAYMELYHSFSEAPVVPDVTFYDEPKEEMLNASLKQTPTPPFSPSHTKKESYGQRQRLPSDPNDFQFPPSSKQNRCTAGQLSPKTSSPLKVEENEGAKLLLMLKRG
jgi:hypothetical protein